MALMLAGPSAQMRSRLTDKTKYVPTALIAKILPAGSASLEAVPTLAEGGEDDLRRRTDEYVLAIRSVTRVWGRFHLKQETLEEHDMYMVWIASWAELSGFGKFVVVDDSLAAGDHDFVKPSLDENGAYKVVLPEMLVGDLRHRLRRG